LQGETIFIVAVKHGKQAGFSGRNNFDYPPDFSKQNKETSLTNFSLIPANLRS
jgi:hypothetical protein